MTSKAGVQCCLSKFADFFDQYGEVAKRVVVLLTPLLLLTLSFS